jgi:hypothetical protein
MQLTHLFSHKLTQEEFKNYQKFRQSLNKAFPAPGYNSSPKKARVHSDPINNLKNSFDLRNALHFQVEQQMETEEVMEEDPR